MYIFSIYNLRYTKKNETILHKLQKYSKWAEYYETGTRNCAKKMFEVQVFNVCV